MFAWVYFTKPYTHSIITLGPQTDIWLAMRVLDFDLSWPYIKTAMLHSCKQLGHSHIFWGVQNNHLTIMWFLQNAPSFNSCCIIVPVTCAWQGSTNDCPQDMFWSEGRFFTPMTLQIRSGTAKRLTHGWHNKVQNKELSREPFEETPYRQGWNCAAQQQNMGVQLACSCAALHVLYMVNSDRKSNHPHAAIISLRAQIDWCTFVRFWN